MKIETTDPVTAERQARVKEIARIEGMTSRADKWQAIRNLMFSVNPALREQDLIHQATVNDKRLENLKLTGASKSGSMRALYSMPEYLYRALQTLDPEFRKIQSSKNQLAIKKLDRSVWAVFPEYRLCERL